MIQVINFIFVTYNSAQNHNKKRGTSKNDLENILLSDYTKQPLFFWQQKSTLNCGLWICIKKVLR